jgi:hypothetical protein
MDIGYTQILDKQALILIILPPMDMLFPTQPLIFFFVYHPENSSQELWFFLHAQVFYWPLLACS